MAARPKVHRRVYVGETEQYLPEHGLTVEPGKTYRFAVPPNHPHFVTVAEAAKTAKRKPAKRAAKVAVPATPAAPAPVPEQSSQGEVNA